MSEEEIPKIDVSERGAKLADGSPQLLDRRLFVQLLVFDCPAGTSADGAIDTLAKELKAVGFRFIGPTTAYASMQACGLVDDHVATCDTPPRGPASA